LDALISGGLNGGEGSNSSDGGTGSDSGDGNGNGDTQGNPLDEVYNTLKQYIDANHLDTQITLVNSETYVTIRLKDSVMFQPSVRTILPTSAPVIKNIATAISKVYSRVDSIEITGHTAKIGTDDQNAWDLSTERANTVLFAFMSYGLPQDKFTTGGRGHQQPIAPNNTEAGMAENRRVEIKITKMPVVSSKASSKSNSTTSSKSASSQGTSQQAPSR
jgi:chemotaxis protein MotB